MESIVSLIEGGWIFCSINVSVSRCFTNPYLHSKIEFFSHNKYVVREVVYRVTVIVEMPSVMMIHSFLVTVKCIALSFTPLYIYISLIS